MTFLQVRDLTVKSKSEVIVDSLSLDLREGKVLALLAGADTNLQSLGLALIGMQLGEEVLGSVWLENLDLLSAKPAERRALRGSRIGYVGGDLSNQIHPHLSARRQVALAIRAHTRLRRKPALNLASETLIRLGVDPKWHRIAGDQLPAAVSRRVLLSMALANSPQVLIFEDSLTDEGPIETADFLSVLLAERDRLKLSILVLTHRPRLASLVADDVEVLYRGRCLEIGGVREVLLRPESPVTVDLLSRAEFVPTDQAASFSQGCIYSGSCRLANSELGCQANQPSFTVLGPGHAVACHASPTARHSYALGEVVDD